MAITNLNNFKRELSNFTAKEVPTKMMAYQLEVALYLTYKLQEKNPIDTGFSVSNWRLAVDTSPKDVIGTRSEAHYHKVRSGRPLKPLGRQALQFGALYDVENGVRRYNAREWNEVGHKVRVFNNVPYVKYINNTKPTSIGGQVLGRAWIKLAIQETKTWMQTVVGKGSRISVKRWF